MADLAGDISLVVNFVALLLLIVGVYGRKGSKKSLMMHGYLSILGFTLKMATVLIVMIPFVVTELPEEALEMSGLDISILWAKIIIGVIGTMMGFICIVPWLGRHRDLNSCLRVRRWMLPTFVVWAITVFFGMIVHLFEV